MTDEQKTALNEVLEELSLIEATWAVSDYRQRSELRSRWFRATGRFDRALERR